VFSVILAAPKWFAVRLKHRERKGDFSSASPSGIIDHSSDRYPARMKRQTMENRAPFFIRYIDAQRH